MNTKLAWGITAVALVAAVAAGMLWGDQRPDASASLTDRHFIEQMIPHHEGAIAMAAVALERSKRTEVRTLAQGIIEAQTREIEDMRGWYRAWFGTDVPEGGGMMHGGGGAMHMEGMAGDMDRLRSAEDFDQEFLQQMIVHHEMAVMMGRMLEAGTTRAEMRTLADDIITSQTREIEQMRSWLLGWYDGSN